MTDITSKLLALVLLLSAKINIFAASYLGQPDSVAQLVEQMTLKLRWVGKKLSVLKY